MGICERRQVTFFKACHISVRPDGTNDRNEIHYLKIGGVAEDIHVHVASLIVQQTASFQQAQGDVDNDWDPFADVEEDDNELETNEVATVVLYYW